MYRSCINTALKYQRTKRRINKVSLEELSHDTIADEDYPEYKVAMDKLLHIMEQELEEFHWYDAKVMRIHMQGTSMNKLHRESEIGLTSIKNTVKNGKARIYEKVKRRLGKTIKTETTTKSKGLGDTIEKITTATGIKAAVKAVAGDDCGCEERKEKLNKLFPYKREPECLTEQELDLPIYWRTKEEDPYLR